MGIRNGLNSNASTLYSHFKEISSLTLSTESPRIPGSLLIDLTMKPPGSFESANPGLVIGKHFINSLIIYYNKVMYKIFKI